MNRINPLGHAPIDPGLGRTAPSTGTSSRRASSPGDLQKPASSDFRRLLDRQIGQDQAVRFSAHALNRLQSRSIPFSDEAMSRLTDAVNRAQAKGAREALVLMPGASGSEDLAFVVSVPNRTVITAMDGSHTQENVFTNIDSAVVAR